MARFHGGISGTKVPKKDFEGSEAGLTLFVKGRNGGITVTARVLDNQDVFEIFQNFGSSGSKPDVFIGKLVDGKFHPDVC